MNALEQLLGTMSEERRSRRRRQRFAGFDVTIENPAGSVRSGIDADGRPWHTRLVYPYGYLNHTKGGDGECPDCYLGPWPDAPEVYAIHQNNPKDGSYDETKYMLGFRSANAAKLAYLLHYNRPGFFRSMTIIPVERFRSMLTDSKPGSAHWKKKHGRTRATDAIFSAEFDPEKHPRGGYPENRGEFSPAGEPYIEWYRKNPPPKIPAYQQPDISHFGPKPPGGGNSEQQAKYKMWSDAVGKFLSEHSAAYHADKKAREEAWYKAAREAQERSPEGIAEAKKSADEKSRFVEKNKQNINALRWAEANAHSAQRPAIKKIREALENGTDVWGPKDIRAAWFKGARAFSEKRLRQLGWKMEHRSESGSVYYRSPDGRKRLRLSNHSLGYGDYGQREQIHYGPEVVLDHPLTEKELREAVGEEIDDQTFSAIAAANFEPEDSGREHRITVGDHAENGGGKTVKEESGNWITIGGAPAVRGGKMVKHAGGAPVEVKGGRIEKGPPSLAGKKISSLGAGKTPVESLLERVKQKKVEQAQRIHPSLRTPEQHALLTPPASAEKQQPRRPEGRAPTAAAPEPRQGGEPTAAPTEAPGDDKWWQKPPEKKNPFHTPAAKPNISPEMGAKHPFLDRQTGGTVETDEQKQAREGQESAADRARNEAVVTMKEAADRVPGEPIPKPHGTPQEGPAGAMPPQAENPTNQAAAGESATHPQQVQPNPTGDSSTQPALAPQAQIPQQPTQAKRGRATSANAPPRQSRGKRQSGAGAASGDVPQITHEDFAKQGWDGIAGWMGMQDRPESLVGLAKEMAKIEGKQYGVMQLPNGKWIAVSKAGDLQSAQASPQGTPQSSSPEPASLEPTASPESGQARPDLVQEVAGEGKRDAKGLIRQQIMEGYKSAAGGVPDDVHQFIEGLQNPYTFSRNSPYRGEVKQYMGGKEGGSEGVAIARSGAVSFTDDARMSGGEDAIVAMKDRYGEKGEKLYWQSVRERAGIGFADALEHARKSEDPNMRMMASIHDAMRPATENKPQQIIDPKHLQPGEQVTVQGIPVTVVEDQEGEITLRDAGELPTVPRDAIGKLPIDRGSLRDTTPKAEDLEDPFAHVEAQPEDIGEEAQHEQPEKPAPRAEQPSPQAQQPAGAPAEPIKADEPISEEMKVRRDVARSHGKNPEAYDRLADEEWEKIHEHHKKQLEPPPESGQQASSPEKPEPETSAEQPSHAQAAPEVDTRRQLGLFAKTKEGEAAEVGERAGQADLFNPDKYRTGEKPREEKTKPQFDPRHTEEMFPATEKTTGDERRADMAPRSEPQKPSAESAATNVAGGSTESSPIDALKRKMEEVRNHKRELVFSN